MEDGLRRSKGARRPGHAESRITHERRPLKTVQLAPPQYEVPAQYLIDSYIEKEIRFAGIVSDVSKYVDATNRTDVLREIDRGKREKCICWKPTFEEDAIFSLSVHNIKISRRDGEEELLLRLAAHEVEAMSYIRDDDQNILCIKFGETVDERDCDGSDVTQLAVLYCESRECAEELCSLMTQCFQLVYTDATMRFLDDKVNEAAAGLSMSSSTVKSEMSNSRSMPRQDASYDNKNLGFLSQSSSDLVNNTSTLSSANSRSLPRRSSNAQSESDSVLSPANEQLLQDYTRRLYTKLNIGELRQFAMLVKAWHTQLPFKDFCDQVLELYGPDRKHLILGMRPFIPEKDLSYFEAFLDKIGLSNMTGAAAASGSGTLSNGFGSRSARNSFSTSSGYSGAASTGTGTGQPDDIDKLLSNYSSNIDNLGNSVTMDSVHFISGST